MSDDDPEIVDISAELLRRQEEAEEAAPMRQVRSQPMPTCEGCSPRCERLPALGLHVCARVRSAEIAAYPPRDRRSDGAGWSAPRAWDKPVAKRWRSKGAPKTPGREAVSDEVPAGARRIATLASQAGWETLVTYSEGPEPEDGPATATAVVRAAKPSDGVWACAVYRRPGAKWALSGCLLADRSDGLRSVKAGELKSHLGETLSDEEHGNGCPAVSPPMPT
jgi:hypothetical protein